MARIMKLITVVTAASTLAFALLYHYYRASVCLTIAIICGTTFYHFFMRLTVGLIFDRFMHNRADYYRRWYRVSSAEMKVYKSLRVRKWKNKMPSFDPSLFDPAVHSPHEIAQAMCQAELVHETIILLSFLPIIEIIWFGDPAVFIITSVIAALFDLSFVIMQRFNRPRVLKLIERQQRAEKKDTH